MPEAVATALALGVLGAAWGAMVWAPSDTVRWLLGGGSVVGAATLVLWTLLGPVARYLSGERTELTAAERASLTAAERVEAVTGARSALMQSVTGLVVIVGVVFTAAGLLYTARTLDTTRQGQVSDRYTKAIEQLGSTKPEVRMGGIYALERLMIDSSRDLRTIIEVLSAYIRSHAQDEPPIGSDKTRLAVDVESALTVLGRAHIPTDTYVDLTNADFHDKNLSGAGLRSAGLSRADLSGANLSLADLTQANLTQADLSGANLTRANLSRAEMPRSDLSGADLTRASLTSANLGSAKLVRADLTLANLAAANLTSANLTGAGLNSADLTGTLLLSADLTGANLVSTDLSRTDLDHVRGRPVR